MRALGRGGEALGFEFVGELAELVEIDAGPEAERMGYGLGRGAATCLRRFSEAGTDRSIDGFLERDALFASTLLQNPGKIVVDGQRGAHSSTIDVSQVDVKTSRPPCTAAVQKSCRIWARLKNLSRPVGMGQGDTSSGHRNDTPHRRPACAGSSLPRSPASTASCRRPAAHRRT